jgi:hypothetical protein
MYSGNLSPTAKVFVTTDQKHHQKQKQEQEQEYLLEQKQEQNGHTPEDLLGFKVKTPTRDVDHSVPETTTTTTTTTTTNNHSGVDNGGVAPSCESFRVCITKLNNERTKDQASQIQVGFDVNLLQYLLLEEEKKEEEEEEEEDERNLQNCLWLYIAKHTKRPERPQFLRVTETGPRVPIYMSDLVPFHAYESITTMYKTLHRDLLVGAGIEVDVTLPSTLEQEKFLKAIADDTRPIPREYTYSWYVTLWLSSQWYGAGLELLAGVIEGLLVNVPNIPIGHLTDRDGYPHKVFDQPEHWKPLRMCVFYVLIILSVRHRYYQALQVNLIRPVDGWKKCPPMVEPSRCVGFDLHHEFIYDEFLSDHLTLAKLKKWSTPGGYLDAWMSQPQAIVSSAAYLKVDELS